jgi:hypothetical protein
MLTALQMTWQAVSVLMIAEIVSNGMLSLPGALAVVGVSEPVPLSHVSVLLGSSISLGGRSRKGFQPKQITQKCTSRKAHMSYNESFPPTLANQSYPRLFVSVLTRHYRSFLVSFF